MLSVSELRRERSEISAARREGGRGVAWEVFLFRSVKAVEIKHLGRVGAGEETFPTAWRRDFPCCSVVVAPLQGRNKHGLGSVLPKNKVP